MDRIEFGADENESVYTDTAKLRNKIDADVEEFLNSGGSVTIVDPGVTARPVKIKLSDVEKKPYQSGSSVSSALARIKGQKNYAKVVELHKIHMTPQAISVQLGMTLITVKNHITKYKKKKRD